ncbi:hypothetical protein BH11PLA2_BH11PLA2_11690 [soil metagenome]
MNRIAKLVCCGLSLGTVTAAMTGCDPASLSYFLFKGDGNAPAAYPLKPAEGKKNITVAVIVSAPNAPVEFAGVERDLTNILGRVFAEQTAKAKVHIKIIDQAKLDRFKLATPGWKTMSQTEVGKLLGADYVIEASVTGLNLYEAGTGRLMYQGQGTVSAVVYDVAAGKEHGNYFVNAKLEAKPADAVPPSQYRTLLVQRIAEEISWKHLPHQNDRRVNPVE